MTFVLCQHCLAENNIAHKWRTFSHTTDAQSQIRRSFSARRETLTFWSTISTWLNCCGGKIAKGFGVGATFLQHLAESVSPETGQRNSNKVKKYIDPNGGVDCRDITVWMQLLCCKYRTLSWCHRCVSAAVLKQFLHETWCIVPHEDPAEFSSCMSLLRASPLSTWHSADIVVEVSTCKLRTPQDLMQLQPHQMNHVNALNLLLSRCLARSKRRAAAHSSGGAPWQTLYPQSELWKRQI